MLENNKITPEALEEIRKVIYDDEVNREVAEHNFNLGRKYFSYDTLEEKLDELINKATGAA
jgi:hypothetical protein